MMHILKRLPILRRFSTSAASRVHPISPTTSSNQGWIANEELLEDYGPTGYHPVAVGDVLDSRYRIIRKLGWGIYSTVWLVQYESNASQSFGALKVLTGLATGAEELHELDYLQCMRDRSPLHPGYSHVLKLLDHFYHHGPNGKHLCLVTEPLTENLCSFSNRWKNLRIPTALLKRITRQVVLGLDYLHNECNIIHTDIKPSNIILAAPNNASSFFATASLDGSVETSTGLSPDGRPIVRTLSRPTPYPLPSGDLNTPGPWSETEARLADVGVSCWADKVSEHFTDLIQSPAMRAPEVCIGSGWGKPADIWSLGCTVYELAVGHSLFPPHVRDGTVVFLHTLMFGEYPEEMVERGQYRDVYFNQDGSFKVVVSRRMSLKTNIYGPGELSNAAAVFLDFLQVMLTLDPAKRASCKDLLAHEWLDV